MLLINLSIYLFPVIIIIIIALNDYNSIKWLRIKGTCAWHQQSAAQARPARFGVNRSKGLDPRLPVSDRGRKTVDPSKE